MNQNRIEKCPKHKETKLELRCVTQAVESLHSNCESLSSNLNTTKKKKKPKQTKSTNLSGKECIL
jgi:hypothetical protein